jgi:hypothetical protein
MMVASQNWLATAAALMLLLACLQQTRAYDFDMVFQTKCIMEEVVDDEMDVSGSYQAVNKNAPDQIVLLDMKVR